MTPGCLIQHVDGQAAANRSISAQHVVWRSGIGAHSNGVPGERVRRVPDSESPASNQHKRCETCQPYCAKTEPVEQAAILQRRYRPAWQKPQPPIFPRPVPYPRMLEIAI